MYIHANPYNISLEGILSQQPKTAIFEVVSSMIIEKTVSAIDFCSQTKLH